MELERSQKKNVRTGVMVQATTGVAQQKQKISNGDDSNDDGTVDGDKLKERAERCRYYWNVERHMVQKLSSENSERGKEYMDVKVTPQFKGVYSSSTAVDNDDGEEEIVPGYGKVDIANKQQGVGFFSMVINDGDDDEEEQHEWMVFEYISSTNDDEAGSSSPALTLLDTMEVSIYSI